MPKNKKTSCDKRLLVAKDMPPLRRTQPNREYSYDNDDVFKWLAQRPGIINFVFDKLNYSGYIFYDKDSETWQGIDYEE